MKKFIFYAVALLSVASLLTDAGKMTETKARARTSKGSSGLKKRNLPQV